MLYSAMFPCDLNAPLPHFTVIVGRLLRINPTSGDVWGLYFLTRSYQAQTGKMEGVNVFANIHESMNLPSVQQ